MQRTLLWSATVLLVAAALYLGSSTWRVYTKMVAVRAERIEAEDERTTLTTRSEGLAAALATLNTERGVEEEIRARYPLVKPGEVEFILVDADSNPATASAPVGKIGLWERLRGFLGL